MRLAFPLRAALPCAAGALLAACQTLNPVSDGADSNLMLKGFDPDAWKIIDGKLYIFGGRSSKSHFLMDEERNLELAHRDWRDEVEAMPSRIQTARRLVFEVPHYRSGKALEEAWLARKGT